MQLKLSGETITSLELVEQINFFRGKEGTKTKLQHNDLLKVIRDEFQEEISLGKISQSNYTNKRGRKYPMFILTLSQAKQVLVRESKFVRRAIIKYIEELEENLKTKPLQINSNVMIPSDKIQYWQKIRELSEEATNVRSKIYHKLCLLSKMASGITFEVDKLSNIVFETEYCIDKLDNKETNLNKILKVN